MGGRGLGVALESGLLSYFGWEGTWSGWEETW